jgi:hypothetical protein
MATAINNGDIRALLDSFDQRLANMGQQITDLQHQQQHSLSNIPAPATANGISSWNAANIGYFYPDMPLSWGTGDVIDREGQVYCRGVYGFTDRLKVAVKSRNRNFVENLSQNMETCFRGEALRWWNDEVNTFTRRGLVHSDSIEEWSEILQKRFKTPPGQAWSNLDNTRYTLDDVRNKRSVSVYVSSLVSAAKQCGGTQEFPMVLRAWKHLDLPLRRTIDEPIEGTTIKDFMELLIRKQSTWVGSYKQCQDIRQHVHEFQSSVDNTPRIPGRSTDDTRLFDATHYAPTYPGTSGYLQRITDKAALISSLNSSSLDDCAQKAKLPDQTRNLPEPDVETECLDNELDDHESFDAMASAYNANLLLIQAINQSDKLVVVPKETNLGIPSDCEDREISMVKPDVVLDFSHLTPGQNRVQFEPTESQLLTPKQPLPSVQQCQQYDPGYAAKEGASATTEIVTGIAMAMAKNYSKVITVLWSDNAFWRGHGGYVGRPEDHG